MYIYYIVFWMYVCEWVCMSAYASLYYMACVGVCVYICISGPGSSATYSP